MENLSEKDFEPETLVDIAIEDPKILTKLIKNLEIKDDTIRYNSHKVLLIVSQNQPEVLYLHWDFFFPGCGVYVYCTCVLSNPRFSCVEL